MKFTDGQWLHQIGVTASYAAQTTEAVRERDEARKALADLRGRP